MCNVVIIGGMAAGCKTAARLSRLSPDYQIIIVERNPIISFGSCGLPLYASGELDSIYDLAKTAYGKVRDTEYFRDVKGITVLTNTEVVNVSSNKQEVTIKNNKSNETKTLAYDKLVFATGSKLIEPQFQFPDSPNISSFHSAQDAKIFREAAQKGKVGKAVVIGGGFIGCELVEALTMLWGIETVLIEKEDLLLSTFLDSEISKLVENRILKNKIQILLSKEVIKIDLNDQELPIVYLNDGNKIECDYVFYNLGVKPNSLLAQKSGISIGETGGIIVDEQMRTNLTNVWAAGDCVEIKNLVTNKNDFFALGSLSNRTGRIVADSIAGKQTAFNGATGSISLKLFNLISSATGLTEKKAKELELNAASVIGCWSDRPDYHPDAKNLFGKLVFEKSSLKLLGLQLVGEGEVNRYLDLFAELLANGKTVHDLINVEHSYTPAHSSPISPLNYLGYMVLNQEEDGVNICTFNSLSKFDGLVLDVREEEEIISSLDFEKLTNSPLSSFTTKLQEINLTQPTTVICEKGPRAYEAARLLKNKGHKDIQYFGGGVTLLDEIITEKVIQIENE